VHIELDIEGSGLTYQHGDHVGVWPSNADVEVDRLLCALGLWEKRDTVIDVTSLDPTLAKVPFPVPTTYGTVLRHYLDISALVGRQVIGNIAQHAPTPEAEAFLKRVNEKAEYSRIVGAGCLKLGEVLQLAAGNDLKAAPTAENTTAWNIPFDKIVSSIPRLQPRYYSISSSPKLHPNKVHVTCVVLKYNSAKTDGIDERLVFGVGSNYLLNVKFATHSNNEDYLPLVSEPAEGLPAQVSNPAYAIMGPRSAYKGDASYKIPVHIRRSTFRLPTNPRTPVIMIGPGTVSTFCVTWTKSRADMHT
jgi:NADPH-ferrihemoprotein reductase